VNESRYLAESGFPFTEDELYRAFCLLQSEQDARYEAHLIAACVRGEQEGGWSISDEVLGALALLSADLRERADAYMRARWEVWRLSGLDMAAATADWQRGCAALAEWVRQRQAGETVSDEPPPWPGVDER
jgi:hypothetical protein